MKTVAILKNDIVLQKIILDCITCNDESVKTIITDETKRLLCDAEKGYIDSNFRIEVIDKLSTFQFLY